MERKNAGEIRVILQQRDRPASSHQKISLSGRCSFSSRNTGNA